MWPLRRIPHDPFSGDPLWAGRSKVTMFTGRIRVRRRVRRRGWQCATNADTQIRHLPIRLQPGSSVRCGGSGTACPEAGGKKQGTAPSHGQAPQQGRGGASRLCSSPTPDIVRCACTAGPRQQAPEGEMADDSARGEARPNGCQKTGQGERKQGSPRWASTGRRKRGEKQARQGKGENNKHSVPGDTSAAGRGGLAGLGRGGQDRRRKEKKKDRRREEGAEKTCWRRVASRIFSEKFAGSCHVTWTRDYGRGTEWATWDIGKLGTIK